MYSVIIGGLAALFYLLTGGLLGARLSHPQARWRHLSGFALIGLGAIAVLLHALLLSRTIAQPGEFDLSFFNALSITGWLTAALLIVLTLFRPLENLGIVLLPCVALTVILSLLFPSHQLTDGAAVGWPLRAHVLLSVLAFALLTLATLQALLLALVDRRLRHRQPGGFVRALPSLTTLETLLFQLIAAGFGLLSLALLSGFLFLEDIFAQHLVHKTVLGLLAWVLFGTLLWGRWRYGWRGRTAVRWTLGGFVTLLLAYFGSQLVLQLILARR